MFHLKKKLFPPPTHLLPPFFGITKQFDCVWRRANGLKQQRELLSRPIYPTIRIEILFSFYFKACISSASPTVLQIAT